MARIKIEDLPVMEDMSAQEIKGIFGGFTELSQLGLGHNGALVGGFKRIRAGGGIEISPMAPVGKRLTGPGGGPHDFSVF